MRVRVYDRGDHEYYRSELYAIFFSGIFERWLVIRNGRLRLVDRCHEEDGLYYAQINRIDPDFPRDWILLSNGDISDFSAFPKHLPEDKWPAFRGYSWVWEDRKTVLALLSGQAVPLSQTGFAEQRPSSLLPGWNYVSTQEEADSLMEQTCNLHDSVLVGLRYVSGSAKTAEGWLLASDHIRQVTMEFHSQWVPPLELVFEAVEALDLRPAGDNYGSNIMEATLRVRNTTVFFCDGPCSEETSYPGTKISAYSLRWRFLPEQDDDKIRKKKEFTV